MITINQEYKLQSIISIISISLIIIATIGFYMSYKAQIWHIKASQWPKTQGVLAEVELKKHRGIIRNYFAVKVNYSYNILNKTYHSNRFDLSHYYGKQNKDIDKAQKWVEHHLVGDKITVYYNPSKLDQAVLENTIHHQKYIINYLIFTGLLILGVISFILVMKEQQKYRHLIKPLNTKLKFSDNTLPSHNLKPLDQQYILFAQLPETLGKIISIHSSWHREISIDLSLQQRIQQSNIFKGFIFGAIGASLLFLFLGSVIELIIPHTLPTEWLHFSSLVAGGIIGGIIGFFQENIPPKQQTLVAEKGIAIYQYRQGYNQGYIIPFAQLGKIDRKETKHTNQTQKIRINRHYINWLNQAGEILHHMTIDCENKPEDCMDFMFYSQAQKAWHQYHTQQATQNSL